MTFQIVFFQVLIMLLCMAVGYLMVKSHKVELPHLKSFSAMLLYVCGPCMIINALISMDHTKENILNIGLFFVVSLLLQVVFCFVLYFLFKRKLQDSRYRILIIGAILGNNGFFGLPLVSALFPPIASAYSIMYLAGMNLLAFTVGIFMITGDKKYIIVVPMSRPRTQKIS